MILIHFNSGSLRRHEQLIQIVQKGSEKTSYRDKNQKPSWRRLTGQTPRQYFLTVVRQFLTRQTPRIAHVAQAALSSLLSAFIGQA